MTDGDLEDHDARFGGGVAEHLLSHVCLFVCLGHFYKGKKTTIKKKKG
jgi:hypothetical protein